VRVVGSPTACTGFALAGLPTVEVATPREGATLVASLAVDVDVGVVLVQQDVLDAMPEVDRRELARRPVPIIVPFPGPLWAEEGRAAEEIVLALLQRAIGYRMRLR
jgi:V/A-type H+-transporting ATPase subunit F